MSRHFKPITLQELKNKLAPLIQSEDFPFNLPKAVEKDIAKIEFDWENYEFGESSSGGFANYPCGFEVLPNGMPALFINAGGDWEEPVCFLIYFDGSALRGYVPKSGNIWNRKSKQAYGNDEEVDYDKTVLTDFLEEAKEWISDEQYQAKKNMLEGDFSNELYYFFEGLSSKDAIFKDVVERIVLKT